MVGLFFGVAALFALMGPVMAAGLYFEEWGKKPDKNGWRILAVLVTAPVWAWVWPVAVISAAIVFGVIALRKGFGPE